MNAVYTLPLTRVRDPRFLGTVVLSIITASFLALLGRLHGSSVTSALLDTFAPLVLPFTALAVTSAIVGGGRLSSATDCVAIIGGSRRKLALSILLAATALSGIVTALLGAGSVLALHRPYDPPLLRDVLSTAWISLLGGAAYGSLAAAASSFGKRGGGRTAFFFLDLIVGGGTGLGAALLPRGHLRNLLGGAAPLECSQPLSVASLALIMAASALIVALRAERR